MFLMIVPTMSADINVRQGFAEPHPVLGSGPMIQTNPLSSAWHLFALAASVAVLPSAVFGNWPIVSLLVFRLSPPGSSKGEGLSKDEGPPKDEGISSAIGELLVMPRAN